MATPYISNWERLKQELSARQILEALSILNAYEETPDGWRGPCPDTSSRRRHTSNKPCAISREKRYFRCECGQNNDMLIFACIRRNESMVATEKFLMSLLEADTTPRPEKQRRERSTKKPPR